MLVEEVTTKNRLTILGLVVVLLLLSACGQSPTPVPDTPLLTEKDVLELVSTFIQTSWRRTGGDSFVPCSYMTRSTILQVEEDASASYRGLVWIVNFPGCGTFLVDDRTGFVTTSP